MPETRYNLYDAKTALSELVDRAAAGEQIVIAKHGRPLARLSAYVAERKPREPGGWEGRVSIGADFDDPLPDELVASFEGGDDG